MPQRDSMQEAYDGTNEYEGLREEVRYARTSWLSKLIILATIVFLGFSLYVCYNALF
ncbi:hypothetical protein ACFLS9_02375 [Bacteroidota bacterium]